ncbi:hypothetical protein [Pseudoalteromonas obscura]|uniref:Uncharacterized protein n=1 Tax=Pseudoalteromonas obscura TaxID=3048491 RepID=A0ABT7EH50_9GAMM|nr:hypothetical protein [Pseudoalteromonas sp. P94(2023)]MDK2594373.1 hypothetical protein [Pseudoalteromonas sp. P94(2023)]
MKYLLAIALLLSAAALARGTVNTTMLKSEADFVEFHCRGEIEHRLPDKTRIDCLNDEYAIEYDFAKKWAEAIGQSLYYSAMTGKKAGIVLIVNSKTKERYLRRIEKTIEDKELNVTVWTVNQGDHNPPKKFM